MIKIFLAPFALLALPPIRAAWPPTAAPLVLAGKFDDALAIEPAGGIAYRAGKATGDVRYFERGREIDPTNFQNLRALAEAYEASGRRTDAEKTWRELADKAEGPMGTIRAIPETTDVNPAYAYEALGEHEKAAQVVERYSRTATAYQMQEFALVPSHPEVVLQRREGLKILYSKALDGLGLSPDDSRRAETLSRLDGMWKLSAP